MENSENGVYIPNDSTYVTFHHISPWFCEIREVEGEQGSTISPPGIHNPVCMRTVMFIDKAVRGGIR